MFFVVAVYTMWLCCCKTLMSNVEWEKPWTLTRTPCRDAFSYKKNLPSLYQRAESSPRDRSSRLGIRSRLSYQFYSHFSCIGGNVHFALDLWRQVGWSCEIDAVWSANQTEKKATDCQHKLTIQRLKWKMLKLMFFDIPECSHSTWMMKSIMLLCMHNSLLLVGFCLVRLHHMLPGDWAPWYNCQAELLVGVKGSPGRGRLNNCRLQANMP